MPRGFKTVGPYKLLEQLGRGTYGQVFSAQHVSNEKKFAIKKIQYNVSQDYIFIHFREISILKSISHPSIIEIIDVVVPSQTETDCIYIVFPLHDSDLRSYIKKHFTNKRVPFNLLKDISVQLLDGLAYLHGQGILHRDLKLANILIDWKSLQIRICDFGLARSLSHRVGATESVPALTHEIVTLWYRAPEVILGAPNYDSAIDVWSIGVVFLEMLWGVCPFNGRTEIDTLMKIFGLVGTPDEENCPSCVEWEFWSGEYPMWNPDKALYRMKQRDTSAREDFLEVVENMLRINPKRRTSCANALRQITLLN
jgi:serine/threonine protein kinase